MTEGDPRPQSLPVQFFGQERASGGRSWRFVPGRKAQALQEAAGVVIH